MLRHCSASFEAILSEVEGLRAQGRNLEQEIIPRVPARAERVRAVGRPVSIVEMRFERMYVSYLGFAPALPPLWTMDAGLPP